MGDLALGIDCSSTASKVVAWDRSGKAVSEGRAPLEQVRLRPLHAAVAQFTAAAVVGATSAWGGPVSTSQVASSAIIGVGAAEHPNAVRWETGKAMLVAWLLTMPCTALLAAALVAGLKAVGAIE